MKKRIKVLGIYALVSVIIQVGVLVFLNYRYFQGFSESNPVVAKVTKIEEIKKPMIEEGAIDIKASKSMKYVSFLNNSSLNVLNLDNNELKTIADNIIKYINTEDDRVIYVKKTDNLLNFIEYSLETSEEIELGKFDMLDKEQQLSDIQISKFNNYIYIGVQNYNENQIYKLNKSGEFQKVNTKSPNTYGFKVMSNGENIVYLDNITKRVYISTTNKSLYLQNKGNYELIGVDETNKVYIKRLEQDKVKEIIYGSMDESIDFWSKVDIKKDIVGSNIIMTTKGKLYEVNIGSQKLTSIVGDKEINYDGQLIYFNEEYIMTIKNREILKVNIKS